MRSIANGRTFARTRSVGKEMTTAAVHNLQFDSAVDAEDVFSRLPANIGILIPVGVGVTKAVSIRFRVWEQRQINTLGSFSIPSRSMHTVNRTWVIKRSSAFYYSYVPQKV